MSGPQPAVEEGTFIPERRRQRAEAIGSVLRSFVTAAVFTMATLLVFGELGFNLGPLLASAGIVGVALGFGAQSLVKDLIAGLFMLLEDQYGVGDTVDLGEAVGVVETVGLRITTVRDMRGVLWYIRNGEIVRVGNKSQGWSLVVIDIPIGFVSAEEAVAVLRRAAERWPRARAPHRVPRAARGGRRRAVDRGRCGHPYDREGHRGRPGSSAAGNASRALRRAGRVRVSRSDRRLPFAAPIGRATAVLHALHWVGDGPAGGDLSCG